MPRLWIKKTEARAVPTHGMVHISWYSAVPLYRGQFSDKY